MKYRPNYNYNLLYIIYIKNCRFKYTCNDDNSIGCRKQQKLAFHVVTCKFPIISLQCHDVMKKRKSQYYCDHYDMLLLTTRSCYYEHQLRRFYFRLSHALRSQRVCLVEVNQISDLVSAPNLAVNWFRRSFGFGAQRCTATSFAIGRIYTSGFGGQPKLTKTGSGCPVCILLPVCP